MFYNSTENYIFNKLKATTTMSIQSNFFSLPDVSFTSMPPWDSFSIGSNTQEHSLMRFLFYLSWAAVGSAAAGRLSPAAVRGYFVAVLGASVTLASPGTEHRL